MNQRRDLIRYASTATLGSLLGLMPHALMAEQVIAQDGERVEVLDSLVDHPQPQRERLDRTQGGPARDPQRRRGDFR